MKKFLTILFLAGMMLVFTQVAANDVIKTKDLNTCTDKPVLIEGEFIVTFNSGMESSTKEKILKTYKIKKVKKSYKGTFSVFKLDKKSDKKVAQIIEEMKADAGIKTIEQNGYAYATAAPNDSYFAGYQWHYHPMGYVVPGVGGIDMISAWGISGVGFNAGSGVNVAICDTGVDESLDDLAGVYFANGWDFINNDNDPYDDEGHGSHVCGTIAQTTNNSYGCAGMAGGATIIPVKVLDSGGSGSWDVIAEGIEWATDQGADIINLSLGGTYDAQVVEDAVNYAYNNGVLVVCAKGNDGRRKAFFPSDYANAFAVAATHSGGLRASYSNYNDATDITAPGGDTNDRDGDGYIDGVLQQTMDGWYFYYGTSMATPHVVGLAALIWEQNPTFTNDQVRSRIETTAVDLGKAGKDKYYGWGLIDPVAALQ
jgi:serine protease